MKVQLAAILLAYVYTLRGDVPFWEVCGVLMGLYLVWAFGREALERSRLGLHRHRLELLEEFADVLEDGLLDGRGFFGEGRASVSGRWEGRPLRLWLTTEHPARLTVSMRADHSLASFDLTPADLGRGWLRRSSWDVRARGGARLGADFQRAELERCLLALFDHGVGAVALDEHGQLVAEKRFVESDLDGDRLERLCRALCEVTALCERRPLTIPDLGLSFAWTGVGGDVRCPYCHATLASEDLDLTRCLCCRTVHHVVCFQEAKGCTLLGCGGERADRPRRSGRRIKTRAA